MNGRYPRQSIDCLDCKVFLTMKVWPNLLYTARRMANLTQEDFAADCGCSRTLLSHWETGRRPVPAAVKRRILDIMGGYYGARPDFQNLMRKAEEDGGFTTLYRGGMIIEGATTLAHRLWHKSMKSDMVGQAVVPLYRPDMRMLEMTERYFLDMFSRKSEIVSVSFFDRSLLFPEKIVRRTASACDVGAGRILYFKDEFLDATPGVSFPADDVSVVTLDDVA